MGKPYTRTFQIFSSPVTRGNILFSDTMEFVNLWTLTGTGSGFEAAKQQLAVYNGDYALYMKSRSASAAPGDYVQIDKSFAPSPSQFLEFSCFFNIPITARMDNFHFICYFYDGTNYNGGGVSYYPNEPNWKYFDSGGTTVDIPGMNKTLAAAKWHSVRVSLDLARTRYKHITVNTQKVDLSALAFQKAPSAEPISGGVRFKTSTAGAAQVLLVIDDVLITDQELL